MELSDPVAVYDASTNPDAQAVRIALVQSGIPAFVVEDNSPGGLWAFSILPGIFKSQVFVDRPHIEQAAAVIQQYEQTQRSRSAEETDAMDETPFELTCEECGKLMTFPLSALGTVQTCPHCGEYVDVPGDDDEDDFEWSEDEEGEDEDY